MEIADKIYPSVVEKLPSLSGKCYAITGCTTGTGFWAAVAAVRRGAACVLLLNRQSERARDAESALKSMSKDVRIVSVDCDLQSFSSVRRAAQHVSDVAKEYSGLDGLINNAGIMAVPDDRTGDGYDVQMQSNHLSHFLLTQLLMPSLEAGAAARGEARVVQHSSGARANQSAKETGDLEARFFAPCEKGTLGGDGMGACFSRYHQTKLANSVFAMALDDRLRVAGSKVKSVCAEPGVSATGLFGNMMDAHKKETKPSAAPKSGNKKSASMSNMGMFTPQSAADGACSLIEASFGASSRSGDFFMPGEWIEKTPVGLPVKCMTEGKPTPTSESIVKRFQNEALTMSKANRDLLWTHSEKATGVSFLISPASKL
eukprot:TRINITY_DN39802_c0_g1_i1.p1 TRINITY_DN39802_c0_g1~~TRINITY_DN39802_c0_g1_i1.p1  ORF type:complete len:373 (-),score=47.71 TRINITY_DN39802_c0_g1_i1:70-1188(-)